MNRNKLSRTLEKVCKREDIILSRTEIDRHLNNLESEGIPDGLTEENLQDIIFDYLQEKSLLKV